MTRIGIIIGGTRPNRNGIAAQRDDADLELAGLRDSTN